MDRNLRRMRLRKNPLNVDNIIARADQDRNESPPPRQQSYAGWSWDGDDDPYLQPGH